MTPGPLALALTTYAPDVTASGDIQDADEPAASARGSRGARGQSRGASQSQSRGGSRGPSHTPWIKRVYPPPLDEDDEFDRIIALLL